MRCTSTSPLAAPNCFCPGVINIHELSPAAEIKMADDKNMLLAAATCCIIVKQQSQKRRLDSSRSSETTPARSLSSSYSGAAR